MSNPVQLAQDEADLLRRFNPAASLVSLSKPNGQGCAAALFPPLFYTSYLALLLFFSPVLVSVQLFFFSSYLFKISLSRQQGRKETAQQ